MPERFSLNVHCINKVDSEPLDGQSPVWNHAPPTKSFITRCCAPSVEKKGVQGWNGLSATVIPQSAPGPTPMVAHVSNCAKESMLKAISDTPVAKKPVVVWELNTPPEDDNSKGLSMSPPTVKMAAEDSPKMRTVAIPSRVPAWCTVMSSHEIGLVSMQEEYSQFDIMPEADGV